MKSSSDSTSHRRLFSAAGTITVFSMTALCLTGTIRSQAPAKLDDVSSAKETLIGAMNLMKRDAKAAGDQFDQARGSLDRAIKSAQDQKDDQLLCKSLFYRALVDQQQAAITSESSKREELLIHARENYRAVLKLKSNSGPTLNNLGLVIAQSKDPSGAETCFEKAISLRDDRQWVYAENYADYLITRGEIATGRRLYDFVAHADPVKSSAFDKLIANCRKTRQLDELLGYLWNFARDGQFTRVQNTAIELLEKNDAMVDAGRQVELLTICIHCLSWQPRTVGEKESHDLLPRILALKNNDLVEPIRELDLLYKAQKFAPQSYGWWGAQFRNDDPPRGIAPKDAFVELAVALGDSYRGPSKTERNEQTDETARQYYMLALSVNSKDPDARAFLRLSQFYFDRNRKEDLKLLMRKEENTLIEVKLEAYTAQRLERMFDYHRALGLVYGELEQWGPPNELRSAAFQLTHAQTVAKTYAGKPHRPGQPDKLVADDAMLSMLVDAYDHLDRPVDAFVARADLAEALINENDVKKCGEVLAELKAPDGLSEAQKRRVSKLNEQWQKAALLHDSSDQTPLDVRIRLFSDHGDEPAEFQKIKRPLEEILQHRDPKASDREFKILSDQDFPSGPVDIKFNGREGVVEFPDAKTKPLSFSLDGPGGARLAPLRATKAK